MSMQLKIQRSQRGAMLSSKVIFALNARIQLTPEEDELVRKYGLGKLTVYDSEARRKHQDSASEYAGYTQAHGEANHIGRGFYGMGRMFTAAAMAALSLHVTIDSLMNGQHIETKSLDELLGADEAIHQACQRVKVYLEAAATFDGREQVFDF
jgi:hypothetical protein